MNTLPRLTNSSKYFFLALLQTDNSYFSIFAVVTEASFFLKMLFDLQQPSTWASPPEFSNSTQSLKMCGRQIHSVVFITLFSSKVKKKADFVTFSLIWQFSILNRRNCFHFSNCSTVVPSLSPQLSKIETFRIRPIEWYKLSKNLWILILDLQKKQRNKVQVSTTFLKIISCFEREVGRSIIFSLRKDSFVVLMTMFFFLTVFWGCTPTKGWISPTLRRIKNETFPRRSIKLLWKLQIWCNNFFFLFFFQLEKKC